MSEQDQRLLWFDGTAAKAVRDAALFLDDIATSADWSRIAHNLSHGHSATLREVAKIIDELVERRQS